jgi:hypothetical protein
MARSYRIAARAACYSIRGMTDAARSGPPRWARLLTAGSLAARRRARG